MHDNNRTNPTINVCIPVYNFDVRPLVYSLLADMDEHTGLILIDDASDTKYKLLNAELQDKNLIWIELKQNVGRSKIRNLFLQYAQHDYLLFLDCHTLIIPNSKLIQTYRNHIQPSTSVLCGGQKYPDNMPSSQHSLSWLYGQEEMRDADERNKKPNHSFKTNNFLINKNLLAIQPFDERITDYGHEDTLYAIDLYRRGIEITHIDNFVLNADIDTNKQLIEKTEASIRTLIKIQGFYNDPHLLTTFIRLLTFARKIERFRLVCMFRLGYKIFGMQIRKYLTESKSPKISVFNLYKFLYFAYQKEERNNKTSEQHTNIRR